MKLTDLWLFDKWLKRNKALAEQGKRERENQAVASSIPKRKKIRGSWVVRDFASRGLMWGGIKRAQVADHVCGRFKTHLKRNGVRLEVECRGCGKIKSIAV